MEKSSAEQVLNPEATPLNITSAVELLKSARAGSADISEMQEKISDLRKLQEGGLNNDEIKLTLAGLVYECKKLEEGE